MANVKKYLADLDNALWKLPEKKADNPFVGDCATEMERTPDLEQDLASWY